MEPDGDDLREPAQGEQDASSRRDVPPNESPDWSGLPIFCTLDMKALKDAAVTNSTWQRLAASWLYARRKEAAQARWEAALQAAPDLARTMVQLRRREELLPLLELESAPRPVVQLFYALDVLWQQFLHRKAVVMREGRLAQSVLARMESTFRRGGNDPDTDDEDREPELDNRGSEAWWQARWQEAKGMMQDEYFPYKGLLAALPLGPRALALLRSRTGSAGGPLPRLDPAEVVLHSEVAGRLAEWLMGVEELTAAGYELDAADAWTWPRQFLTGHQDEAHKLAALRQAVDRMGDALSAAAEHVRRSRDTAAAQLASFLDGLVAGLDPAEATALLAELEAKRAKAERALQLPETLDQELQQQWRGARTLAQHVQGAAWVAVYDDVRARAVALRAEANAALQRFAMDNNAAIVLPEGLALEITANTVVNVGVGRVLSKALPNRQRVMPMPPPAPLPQPQAIPPDAPLRSPMAMIQEVRLLVTEMADVESFPLYASAAVASIGRHTRRMELYRATMFGAVQEVMLEAAVVQMRQGMAMLQQAREHLAEAEQRA
ncbi:hypothetical protein HYH03_009909 [Edaphochlamys debaryana]|uniref:Uncharacterized protein n=1 Tax=Edaphochlamys debaryana TaxID=47281 RepID=A0A835XX00_9CHLO|nr:hypothetical protein HYH03_009909 [Edaphochlamys debaryana]|eukprot:KAG2491746.1 hypothetical protein HYH03_009909 [Edaphochlamys debaryana]